MQSNLAKRHLFEEAGPDDRPLFRNPHDLAEAIASQRESGNAKSIAAFLGQILIAGQRACPDNLIEEIKAAVSVRLKDQPARVREVWVWQVGRALGADNLTRGKKGPLVAEILFDELLFHAESATDHYIITSRPAEMIPSSGRAQSLREILLRRLNLLPPAPGSAAQAPSSKTNYTFCLPSVEDCQRWWDSLLNEIRVRYKSAGARFDLATMQEKLQQLDQSDALRLFAIPRIACGCPVVVFNPDSSTPEGFNLYYFSNTNQVSLCKIDPDYLQDWKTFVLSPLETGQAKRERVGPRTSTERE